MNFIHKSQKNFDLFQASEADIKSWDDIPTEDFGEDWKPVWIPLLRWPNAMTIDVDTK